MNSHDRPFSKRAASHAHVLWNLYCIESVPVFSKLDKMNDLALWAVLAPQVDGVSPCHLARPEAYREGDKVALHRSVFKVYEAPVIIDDRRGSMQEQVSRKAVVPRRGALLEPTRAADAAETATPPRAAE